MAGGGSTQQIYIGEKMIAKIKEFIKKAYFFWVYQITCRKEPYTHQFTRAMIHHGIFFWLGFYVLTGWMFYLLFGNVIWQQILGVLGLILLAWLTDHLIDEARLNNEKYDD